MPSKISKPRPPVRSQLKSELNCAEKDYSRIAKSLIARAKGRAAVVLLEGEMGAGKSTFARALLAEIGVKEEFQGSPTFAITHTYFASKSEQDRVIHTDLYRLRHEGELHETGVEEWIWSTQTQWAIVEWSSLFPDFASQIHERLSLRKWVCEVRIGLSNSGSERDILFREF